VVVAEVTVVAAVRNFGVGGIGGDCRMGVGVGGLGALGIGDINRGINGALWGTVGGGEKGVPVLKFAAWPEMSRHSLLAIRECG
jgi:hypothetical protein